MSRRKQGSDEKLKDTVHQLYIRCLNQGKTDQLIYGEVLVNANDVSREFGREVMELYRKPIKRGIQKANKQIRQTKEHLQLEDHLGLLLLVNDGHELLDPDHVRWILSNTLSRDGFSSIDAVIFFTVNLTATHPDYDEQLLVWAVVERYENRRISEDFFEALRKAWFSHYQSLVGSVSIREIIVEDPTMIAGMENVPAFEKRSK